MVIETDITKMFGIKNPIFGAPMGPYYTTEMCIAISEAGGMGMLSHTNLFGKSSVDEMKANMLKVVEHTDKPFGFNVRTSRMQVDSGNLCRQIPKFIASNPKLREQCLYALTSAGTPKELQNNAFKKLKAAGSQIKHFHVAPALWLAGKVKAAGCDGMVVTGASGGGHQSYEKIHTIIILQQVLEKYPDMPVIACGGFATGRSVAAAIAMGAGGVAMGSRFIASDESEFHENYKNIVPPAKASDTILVTGFLGPIRLWKNEYSLKHGLVADKEAKLAEESGFTIEDLMEDQKHYEQIYEGRVKDGAVLLGQSIGIIESIESCKAIVEKTMADAETHLKKAAASLK